MIADIFKFIFILLEVIVMFNLMILVHELGHFLAARWRGLLVEKFAIWFGKPIWKKTIGGVEYRLGSIPAGGYVANPQLAPMEIMEGEVETDRAKLPPVKPLDKIIVAAAGPAFSFGLAVFLAAVIWIVGRPIGEAETSTVIGDIDPDGAAAKAGLQVGDKIDSVNGVHVTQFTPAGNGRASIVWNIIRSESPIIPITFTRDGVSHTVQVEPKAAPRRGWGRANLRSIGIMPAFTPRIAKVEPGSADAAAGFEAGDFLVKAYGKPLLSLAQLENFLTSTGKPVPVTVERNGQFLEKELPPLLPIVESVSKDSPAATAGIQKGDLIAKVNGQPLIDLKTLTKLFEKTKGQPAVLTIQRGGQTFERTLTPQIADNDTAYRIGVAWDMGAIKWDLDGRLSHIHP
ncbi:MAG TPA: PDZ domain-containing protein, partial [Chthoniobacterales bacterium]|nr:PDZ domain-containing protein [Chthoniobacterales bacterium]